MKRLLDILIVLVSAPIWGPIMLVLTFQVRRKLGSPVFFRQPRSGLNGTIFEMMKFRTMTDEHDSNGELLPDAQRLTDFGRWLRSTSLDELPELLVILRGDMSLVGPRPLLPRYLPRYSPEQARRHEVKPGLTGWAQINGRNSISWEEKFRLDIWYVDHRSILLDMKILFLTALAVVKRDGISAANDATMPEFMGTQAETNPVASPPNPTASKESLGPAFAGALLVAGLWAFPHFWSNQKPPGNFVWLSESTNIAGWSFNPTPVSATEEQMIQADKIFSGEFKSTRESVLAFCAKRFSDDPDEVGLFAHTPDRCWVQAGWKLESASSATTEVEAGGVKFQVERRVFIWSSGQRLLVYFGGLSAGQPLPYRLDHELSVAMRHQIGDTYSRGAQLRAFDAKFWGRAWETFASRRSNSGPKQFIRVATPITGSDLSEADQRLADFLKVWLQPGDFPSEAKSFEGRRPARTASAPDLADKTSLASSR